MTSFEFNPTQSSFPLDETAGPAIPRCSRLIAWRLWRLELMYVYPLGMEMVDGIQKEISCFRRAFSCFAAAKDEQALVSLHESGFFRDLPWEHVAHDMQKEKPIDGWFQYDYVLDLTDGTQDNFTVIG